MEAVTVIATMYAGSFVGQPLYCSTPQNPLFYSPETIPFIALPVEDYTSGKVQCGDPYVLTIMGQDGSYHTQTVYALDAGPFSRFCVIQPDGSCPSIGVDVPSYIWRVNGISAQAMLVALKWGLCTEGGECVTRY